MTHFCFPRTLTNQKPARRKLSRSLASAALMLASALPLSGWSAEATAPAAEPVRERIVSLAPHTTEMLYFIGAGDFLVGAVEYSDFPPEALKVPRVGGYDTISLEKVASFAPTLILLWPSGNPANVRDALRQRGTPLFESEPRSLADISREMRALAARLKLGADAEARIAAFEAKLASLREQHTGARPLKVFYQVWEKPLYTLGGSHFINDLLSVCAGSNVYADIAEPAPVVAFETLLARKPDVILSSRQHGSKALGEWRESWQKWQQIPAVKNQEMHYVDADIFTRPTPRAADAAQALCGLLDSARNQH